MVRPRPDDGAARDSQPRFRGFGNGEGRTDMNGRPLSPEDNELPFMRMLPPRIPPITEEAVVLGLRTPSGLTSVRSPEREAQAAGFAHGSREVLRNDLNSEAICGGAQYESGPRHSAHERRGTPHQDQHEYVSPSQHVPYGNHCSAPGFPCGHPAGTPSSSSYNCYYSRETNPRAPPQSYWEWTLGNLRMEVKNLTRMFHEHEEKLDALQSVVYVQQDLSGLRNRVNEIQRILQDASPAQNGALMNNQVEPGSRANNYWDAYRSSSFQQNAFDEQVVNRRDHLSDRPLPSAPQQSRKSVPRKNNLEIGCRPGYIREPEYDRLTGFHEPTVRAQEQFRELMRQYRGREDELAEVLHTFRRFGQLRADVVSTDPLSAPNVPQSFSHESGLSEAASWPSASACLSFIPKTRYQGGARAKNSTTGTATGTSSTLTKRNCARRRPPTEERLERVDRELQLREPPRIPLTITKVPADSTTNKPLNTADTTTADDSGLACASGCSLITGSPSSSVEDLIISTAETVIEESSGTTSLPRNVVLQQQRNHSAELYEDGLQVSQDLAEADQSPPPEEGRNEEEEGEDSDGQRISRLGE